MSYFGANELKNMKIFMAAAAWSFLVAGAALAQSPAAQSPAEMISAADPAHGMTIFKKCKACHTVEKGGPNRVGPNLWNVVGKDVATTEGYKYSTAMKDFGGVWTPERLFEYLADPRAVVPGTRMSFLGIKNEEDRAALLAYLQTQSDAQ